MSVMQTIEANRKSFNPGYRMTLRELCELRDAFPGDKLGFAESAFDYGYIKGMRAANANKKKAAKQTDTSSK